MALTHAQKTGLEAAILAYLTAEGGRFSRTVAAFKEEAQGPGNNGQGNLVVSGAVLEKAWAMVHHGLKSRSEANTKAFFDAIESGDLAEVQLYECVGVDVKALREDGVDEGSPLYSAAYYNRMEMVRLFLRSGHDKDVVNRNGTTPLLMAAQEGHIAVVQYLVEQGADKDKAKNDGMTPLYIAAQQGHFTVVQYMVEQGANKDKASNEGITPLSAACVSGHVDIAEYLLDHGCNGDHADIDGYTALHYAAIYGHVDIAHVLFRYGAKLDARTNAGETPADVAIRNGHDAFADAIRAEEIRRRDHGFKRDRSTIEGTEEHEAAKRPRVEQEEEEVAVDDNDDDDDDDDDEDEEA